MTAQSYNMNQHFARCASFAAAGTSARICTVMDIVNLTVSIFVILAALLGTVL